MKTIDQIMARKIVFENNITFEIHIWHVVVLWNQSLAKLSKDLWFFTNHYTCEMPFNHC